MLSSFVAPSTNITLANYDAAGRGQLWHQQSRSQEAALQYGLMRSVIRTSSTRRDVQRFHKLHGEAKTAVLSALEKQWVF
jgi:hypothetical protein